MRELKWLALMLLICASSVSITQAQAEDAPPYLYYYSRMLGGIIIERADGTDSRHIGVDVIPPGMTGLAGPGWSPSGRYFAVSGINYADYYTTSAGAYLIDTHGEPAVEWLTFVSGAYHMEWAPDEDVLLVIGSIESDIRSSLRHYLNLLYWLIDPEQRTIAAEFGVFAYGAGDILWELDHDRIRFYIGPQDFASSNQYFEITMMLDGTVLKQPSTREAFNAHYTPLNPVVSNYYNADGTSPSGRYEIERTRDTTLTDTQTGEIVILPRHSQGTVCQVFIWSEEEQHIITVNGTLVAGGGCWAAVLGVTDNTGELWRELGGCSWNFPPCVDWLPGRVDVAALPPGSPNPVQLDHAWIDYNIDNIMFGSPDPEVLPLRLRCGQEQLIATIVNINTEEVLYALVNVRCPYTSAHWYAEEGLAIVTTYNPTHDLIATYSEHWEAGVSIWQRRDDVYERALKLNTNGYLLEFTDDGAYLRARNVNGWKVYTVADILAAIDGTE